MEVEIRKTQKYDLPAVHSLVKELAVFEGAKEQVTADLKVYEDSYKEGVFESIVAVLDGQVVGTCIYYMTFSTWKGKMLYLEDFVVSESHRRMGIGKLLFEEILGITRDRGCVLLKWQVLDWNELAIRFYEKYDAEFDKEWWNGKIFVSRSARDDKAAEF